MKRFLIPALFIVHGNNEAEAEEFAGAMQAAANEFARDHESCPQNFCMLDEKLPTKEVPINPEETECPGTYVTD